MRWAMTALLLGLVLAGAAAAAVPVSDPPEATIEAATQAYLDRLTPEERARSADYWNGGLWLGLFSFLLSLGISLAILATGLSRRFCDLAESVSRHKSIQTALYALLFIALTWLLELPLSIFANYFREQAYGLQNQTFGAWFGDELLGLLLWSLMGTGLITCLYAVVRLVPRTWWVFGTGVSLLFLVFAIAIAPVFIEPLFNRYRPMDEGPIKERILALAQANGVPADDVLQFDASKQSKRVSANVSGFLGTMRIALNDNLLNRCSPEGVEVVMAHEMGHYLLNHVREAIVMLGLVFLAGFGFLHIGFGWVQRRFGARLGIRDLGDVAGLPLLTALLGIFLFLFQPVRNNIIRSIEVEADLFALNASREPEAFAEVALLLAEYRKLDPGPVEEFLAFDHPSPLSRIRMAMRFRAYQPACPVPAAAEPGASPSPDAPSSP